MGAVSGVTLRDVSVAFDGVPALSDVSLSVADGEFFTLVGPSGCGKTTTLRTVAGFRTPDTGVVEIAGEDATGRPPEERNVGVVFQNYALFPHMSVRENVAYGLRFRDPPGGVTTDERVADLLELVDMAGTGDRDPEALSGGQQQRIALARALAPGPDVLLLDEPLSALDARLRERLRVVIRDIQQDQGITTIYVTHDQAEALAISDRVAVIADGGVEQVGPPEEIYREPATRFVAEFVGDNNLFEGAVSAGDPPEVTIDGTTLTLPETDLASGSDLASEAGLASGRNVVLSVRPEDIAVAPRGGTATQADWTTLDATVETSEFLGDAYRLHCRWGDRTLLVKTTGDAPPDGDVTLGIDPAAVTVVDGGDDA